MSITDLNFTTIRDNFHCPTKETPIKQFKVSKLKTSLKLMILLTKIMFATSVVDKDAKYGVPQMHEMIKSHLSFMPLQMAIEQSLSSYDAKFVAI